MPVQGSQNTGVTGAAKFVTSTVGNTVGGLTRTVGNVTGAATRGVGDTITGATGSLGKPVGDAIGSLGTGVESGAHSVARGGSKLFGAAILSKSTLTPLTIATNNERVSPLLHGEINCIQQFFSSPTVVTTAADGSSSSSPRPSSKECVFVATHEPCSLCLSGIAWSGFDNFYHLFTYEDSRDLFDIPYDLQFLREVFQVRAAGESDEELAGRALYNRANGFFTARSFAEVVAEIEDVGERERWAGEVERVKGLYRGLSETYQEGKRAGVDSASVWK